MISSKQKTLFLIAGAGIACVLMLQIVWLHHAYGQTRRQLMVDIEEAFGEAYRKEQTYRIPVVDLVNPGALTIESCGMERIQIIRNCPDPDTIVYRNPSGHSIESFINRMFVDLREHIMPMNINCLADLFGGMLHDKGIPAYFVVERFDVVTGDVLDTSLLPDKRQPEMNPQTSLLLEVSERESLRAIMELTPAVVLGRMTGVLFLTICLSVLLIACFLTVYFFARTDRKRDDVVRSTADVSLQATDASSQTTNAAPQTAGAVPQTANAVPPVADSAAVVGNEVFSIGVYRFDPAKNELCGFGDAVQLNKKENAILHALCEQCGNVVERTLLLEENWGDNGTIYSRSLDTYITTLRKYLKQDPSIQIVTIKGVGYRLVCREFDA